MKITKIDAFRVCVPVRLGSVHSPEFEDSCHPFAWRGRFFAEMPKFVYQVHSDEGITGIGESYRDVSDGAVQHNIRTLLGLDVMKLNLRDLPIPSGREYDGFEVAIYDLVGKKLSVPACQLLGGAYRDQVLMSYWTGRRTPQDAARIALEAKDAGFRSLKMKCALEDPHLERVDRIRSACGPGFGIVLDPNQRFEHPSFAARLAKSLEPYHIDCFEDPVPRWNLDWYRFLRDKTSIPIALHVHAPYGQRIEELIQAIKIEAVDYFNLGGGLAHFVRMAAVADAAGIPVWHGSEVDLGILDAASLHACAAVRNCTLPSDIIGTLVREDDLIAEPLEFRDGFARVPQGPGLGVTLDELALERYTIEKWV